MMQVTNYGKSCVQNDRDDLSFILGSYSCVGINKFMHLILQTLTQIY